MDTLMDLKGGNVKSLMTQEGKLNMVIPKEHNLKRITKNRAEKEHMNHTKEVFWTKLKGV